MDIESGLSTKRFELEVSQYNYLRQQKVCIIVLLRRFAVMQYGKICHLTLTLTLTLGIYYYYA